MKFCKFGVNNFESRKIFKLNIRLTNIGISVSNSKLELLKEEEARIVISAFISTDSFVSGRGDPLHQR